MDGIIKHIDQPVFFPIARGINLIELMMALVVIAILTANTLPCFRDIILANQMTGTGQGHWGNFT